MNLRIVNASTLRHQDDLSNYTIDSFLWVERFNETGYFELYAPFDINLFEQCAQGNYIIREGTDKAMIIEGVELKTDHENGNKLIVTGRTLDSVLDRRIMLEQLIVDTSFQAGVQSILNANVIASRFPERNFPNFVFSTSSDPLVTSPTLKAQFFSENILELITALCQNVGLGFKVTFNSSMQMVFSLYAGVDHSHDQTSNNFVVFSPAHENLLSSNLFSSTQGTKNFALLKGDPYFPTGPSYNNQIWVDGVGAGLLRREMFIDATDLNKNYQDTTNQIPDATYFAQLKERGWQTLSQYLEFESFDAQIDLRNTYTYDVDFKLGDKVQLVDLFGTSKVVTVTEMAITDNVSYGQNNYYPTLE